MQRCTVTAIRADGRIRDDRGHILRSAPPYRPEDFVVGQACLCFDGYIIPEVRIMLTGDAT